MTCGFSKEAKDSSTFTSGKKNHFKNTPAEVYKVKNAEASASVERQRTAAPGRHDEKSALLQTNLLLQIINAGTD